uniref:Glycosyltransferase n=1 Tax=viral metagenome TaxID=1070528 RepID=A0A6C0BB33_9ZZZZ
MVEFGFIILRHVNNELTNKYWIHCYNSIRIWYKECHILIIDDNSDYNFITDIDLYKTTIINSEYPSRGELLPYYYYLHNKLFDVALILHDSVFLNNPLDFSVYGYKSVWDFDHGCDQIDDETTMIDAFDNPDLKRFYENKSLWRGCFGGMTMITHDYLSYVNSRYDISKLLPHVIGRYSRCSFERVIGCLFKKCQDSLTEIHPEKEVLLGDIHNYCKWGITFDEKDNYKDLPLNKVWTGR